MTQVTTIHTKQNEHFTYLTIDGQGVGFLMGGGRFSVHLKISDADITITSERLSSVRTWLYRLLEKAK